MVAGRHLGPKGIFHDHFDWVLLRLRGKGCTRVHINAGPTFCFLHLPFQLFVFCRRAFVPSCAFVFLQVVVDVTVPCIMQSASRKTLRFISVQNNVRIVLLLQIAYYKPHSDNCGFTIGYAIGLPGLMSSPGNMAHA